MTMVVDSSITMAWFMSGELDPVAQQILDTVVADGAVVPSLWRIEVGNTLLHAVRHGKIPAAKRAEALRYLEELDIEIDHETETHAWTRTLDLADRYRLTLYDACYLELALRRHLPLATRDDDLRKAAGTLDVQALGK